MRRAITICALAAVAAVAAGLQDADRPADKPRGKNLLTRYLDAANIHPPVRVEGLTIFPITADDPPRLSGLLTMDQALAKKLLVIEELKSAQVQQAKFINKSGSQMIFLMAGEVITGGKQNRTLATDALLGPDSATELPLYCVQRGRWQGGKNFSSDSNVTSNFKLRSNAVQKTGQNEVWIEVSRANKRLGGSDASEDLSVSMTRKGNVERLAKLRKRVRVKLPDGTVGIVVAHGGKIVGADLFNSAELFSAMRLKVLDSYFSEYALGKGEDDRGDPADAPTQQDVRDHLQACYRAEFAADQMRGAGMIYHLRGARYGQTLGYQKIFRIHPRGEQDRKIRPAPRQYMVHTLLMERIVPVKPDPAPEPRRSAPTIQRD